MKKNILVHVLVLSSFINGYSQIAIGIDANYKIFGDGGVLNNPSFGISWLFHTEEGSTFYYLGYNIGVPKRNTYNMTAYAYDATNPVQTQTVEITNRFTNWYFDFGYGKIVNGDYEDGGLLLYGGLMGVLSRYKTTVAQYNSAQYNLNYNETGIRQTNSAFGIKIGAGYLIRSGVLGFTPYTDVSLPLLKVDKGIPVFFGIGVRVNFFGE